MYNKQVILYQLFTLIGITAGAIVAKAQGIESPKNKSKIEMYIAGTIGLILGAKLPIFILYGGISKITIFSGKSVMGGLLGTFVAVHIYKFLSKTKAPLGGRFAIPFAVCLGFGKIGCYFNGCCGGDFIIPVQLLESALQFVVAISLYIFYRKTGRTDLLFPLYMLSYLILRFLAEFIRDSGAFYLNLTFYQWLSVIFLPVVLYIIIKRIKYGSNAAAR